MFNRLRHLLAIVALLGVTGGHWAALQSVAWTNMLADNLRNDSFVGAFKKTFGGDHPCTLCKQIAAGKQAEKKTEFAPPLKKFEFVSDYAGFVFCTPEFFRLLPQRADSAKVLAHKPPLPPPRSLSA